MSVLTQEDILNNIKQKKIVFKPALDEFQLHSHAVDLRLGFTFLLPKTWHMTAKGREQLNMDFYAENRPEYTEFDTVFPCQARIAVF